MGTYRERFNDKARAGSVRKRQELKLKRNKHLREELQEHEQELEEQGQLAASRKELKRSLGESIKPESKVTAKKRKRIDKYLDLKVKQQERDDLLAKLAAEKVNTSKMSSIKEFGQAKSFADLDSEPESESESDDGERQSVFIDNRRPANGFGFQNLKKVAPAQPKKKAVSWRERLGVTESDAESDKNEQESDDSESSSEGESGRESVSEEGSEEEGLEESSEEEGSEEGSETEAAKPKGADFAAWAHSLDKHETLPTPKAPENYQHTPRAAEHEPIVDYSKGSVERESNYFVHVKRPDDVTESRLRLPALASEQQIMEAIYHNDVVVLTGATGSGKTTQVPQFLYEAGYGSPESSTKGLIGITQPRRVAAVSMADRVSKELGDHGKHVGYQIRFDAKVTPDTRMKFMTDGLLMRELASDLTLQKYSAIIVDEAHERSVNTDILIGMLSRVVGLRRDEGNPLKLIIMSATLRVSDFTENRTLFSKPPPVVSLDARQYPVSVHFNRKTAYDYVEEATKKALKIHEKLPKGGILIFLTGQNEIMQAVRTLKQYANKGKGKSDYEPPSVRLSEQDAVMEEETVTLDFDEAEIDSEGEAESEDEGEEEGFEEEYDGEETKLKILPLYSLLPTSEQLKVFEEVPKDTRLVVVATNVAETSLTIPGIRYVVDCGRAKQRECDAGGIVKFRVSFVSKAAADQRAGRAGRTGPGHCYRIFSSAVYESHFGQFSKPEIMRMPIEGLVLQMKAMGIHKIVNFPFPTPPPRASLEEGIKLLQYLGALKDDQLTPIGKQMSQFPLNPRLSKILLIGNQFDCLPFIVAIVAGLAVGDPFMQSFEIGLDPVQEDEEESVKQKERKQKLRTAYNKAMSHFCSLDSKGDVFKGLAALAGYGYAESTESYCRDNFLREKVMNETEKLRRQIAALLATSMRSDAAETVTKQLSAKLPVPTAKQVAAIKQMIAAGYIDKIAVRADFLDDVKTNKRTNITRMPYSTLFPTDEQYCYIHPDSVLAHLGAQPPEFLIYSTLTQGDDENSKVRLRTLVDVSAGALSTLAANTPLLSYSTPMGGAYAPKMITTVKREAWVVPRMGAAIGSGGVGWDLPPKRVTQVKKVGNWVVV